MNGAPLSSADGRTVLALAGVEAKRNGTNRVVIRCPSGTHKDNHPSASVRLDTGVARCFTCGWTARGTIELHAALNGFLSLGDAAEDLRRRLGDPVPYLKFLKSTPARSSGKSTEPEGTRVVVQRWTYREADGTPAFEVERLQFRMPDKTWLTKQGCTKPKKTFRQCHPGGHPRCIPERYRQGNRPLYRLPELIAAPPHERLFIVEGEKAADALVARGAIATTSSGGSAQPHLSDWQPLTGRHVILWPDNDEAGAIWLQSVQAILNALTKAPVIDVVDVEALKLPRAGDAADYFSRIK